jgi:hypothetical protein
MSPHSPPDLSTSIAASIAAFSSPMTTTPVSNFTQPTVFADQSQSRLMNLPKELRNKIYEFVFCDNSTYVDQPIKYHLPDNFLATSITREQDIEIEMAHVPRPIRLDRTKSPSKDSILPCRQLYSEMGQMQAGAYRAYWTTNHFLFNYAEMSGLYTQPLPARENVLRIREFLIVLRDDYHLRAAFDGIKWTFWLLPGNGSVLNNNQLKPWVLQQTSIQHQVDRIMDPILSSCSDLSPHNGYGLTVMEIREIARHQGIKEEMWRLDEVLYSSDDEEYDWCCCG